MPTLEERGAYLEGRVTEHSHAWEDLKDLVLAMDGKTDRNKEELSQRIYSLELKVERYREELSARIVRLEARVDSLDLKFSRFFLWIIGIQITTFLAIMVAILR